MDFRLRVARQSFGKPSLLLQHLSGWSAASVAIAKGIHDTVAVFLLLVPVVGSLNRRCNIPIIAGIVHRNAIRRIILGCQEICENFTSIDSLPQKRIIGQLVGIIPADF